MKKWVVATFATMFLAGCGTPVANLASTRVSSGAASGPAVEAQRSVSTLRQLTVTSIVKFRDGGSIEVRGYVNRSTYATIKLDRGLGSPTRGKVLIKWHKFGQQASEGEFSALDRSQFEHLTQALKSNASRAGSNLDLQLIEEFVRALEAAGGHSTDPAEPTTVNLAHLVVQQASRLRDGGSLVIRGYVNRSTYVTIKHDMGLGSPTRGKVLLTVEAFGGKDQPEARELGREHWNALRDALERNAGRAGSGLDVSILRAFAERLASE